MENGVAILWKNYLQLFAKSTCKKHFIFYPRVHNIVINAIIIISVDII